MAVQSFISAVADDALVNARGAVAAANGLDEVEGRGGYDGRKARLCKECAPHSCRR